MPTAKELATALIAELDKLETPTGTIDYLGKIVELCEKKATKLVAPRVEGAISNIDIGKYQAFYEVMGWCHKLKSGESPD